MRLLCVPGRLICRALVALRVQRAGMAVPQLELTSASFAPELPLCVGANCNFDPRRSLVRSCQAIDHLQQIARQSHRCLGFARRRGRERCEGCQLLRRHRMRAHTTSYTTIYAPKTSIGSATYETLSIASAMPWPTPIHMAHGARRPPERWS